MLKSYGVGGPCDFFVSPSLVFGTLDFGTSDSGLTIWVDIKEGCANDSDNRALKHFLFFQNVSCCLFVSLGF